MIQKETLMKTCEVAATTLTAEYAADEATKGITIRPGVKTPQNPIYIAFTKKGKEALIVHNITTAVVVLCGGQLEPVLRQCVQPWLDGTITRINLNSNIIKSLFAKNVTDTVEGMETSDNRRLLEIVEKSMNTNDENQIIATFHAMGLYDEDLFDDVDLLDAMFGKTTEDGVVAGMEFSTRNNMLKYFWGKCAFNLPESFDGSVMTMSQIRRYPKRSEDVEAINMAINTDDRKATPAALSIVAEFVRLVGTPRFMVRYAEYIENDRAKLTTLASLEDLQGLVSGT